MKFFSTSYRLSSALAHSRYYDVLMENTEQPSPPPHHRRSYTKIVAVVLIVYFLVAYVIMPLGWERYTRFHPDFKDHPRLTETHDGHPGDPLNIALIAQDQQLVDDMQKAGWYVANPLSIRDDLKIAAATVLDRPYDAAPVSNLFLYGRKEDIAFEMPVGDSPRQRHHVRFWKTQQVDPGHGPVWIGSATFDTHVGLSHTTGQITHHIGEDVDIERDHVLATLEKAGVVESTEVIPDFHTVKTGKNGGGDKWITDGNLDVAVLK